MKNRLLHLQLFVAALLALAIPSYAQSNNTTYVVTTLAGKAGQEGRVDGVRTKARLGLIRYLTVDGAGNIYAVTDGGVWSDEDASIRKISSNGVVTTFATGPFNGIAADVSGNIYATTSQHSIVKVLSGGTLVGIAGSLERDAWGSFNRGFFDAQGTKARFDTPLGIAVDKSGNLFVSDFGNQSIRKITGAGVVTTLAGGGPLTPPGFTNGNGNSALFRDPLGVAVDESGNVYVADFSNDSIRKITSNGDVTTLAGMGPRFRFGNYKDGIGTNAAFWRPNAVAVDGASNVFVIDQNNSVVRKITRDGLVTTIAGQYKVSGHADGVGTNAIFDFSGESGVAVDRSGNLYVGANNTIRKLTPMGANDITFPPLPEVTFSNGLSFNLGATASSGLPVSYNTVSTIASISGSTLTIRGAGSAQIVASQPGNSVYAAATPVSRTLVVGKAPQAINFAQPASEVYGPEKTFAIEATANSGLPVAFTSADRRIMTFSGKTATIKAAGTVTVTASQAGNANYNAASNVVRTLTIAKAPQTITWTNFPGTNAFQLNGKIPLNGTSSSGQAVTYTSANSNILRIAGTNAVMRARGTTTVTASQAGNANYNAASNVVRTIVIK